MSNKKDKVVESLDLGWGYAKFSKTNLETGEVEFKTIPSLAPKSSGQDLSMGILSKRDTVVVEVEGMQYEVGPDSIFLDNNDITRSLNNNYIYTEQYKAVFYGALHYMDKDVIDLLVVGLPISGMSKSGDLEKIVKGKHEIYAGKIVEVKNVLVLPQPLGGLYYCMSLKGEIEDFEYLHEEQNLIIDPGFLTFDFLIANGDKLNELKSDAYDGGVSKILRSIANSISDKFNIKYTNLSAIDKGLKRKFIKINGKKEDLLEHIKNTKSVIEGSVNFMKNTVGDGADIDNIILIGGGSDIFKKTIESFYEDHVIHVVEDPQLANVKGFYEAGLKHLESLK